MKADKKIILIFPFNLLSHYLRCLVLADTYPKEHFKILFLSAAAYDPYVKLHGYETFNCKQFDTQYVMQCIEKHDFSWLNAKDIEAIMLDQVRAIKTCNADIVIGDMAPTLKMASEITGIQHISLLNGYMTRFYAFSRKVSRGHWAFYILNLLPDRVAKLMTNIGEQIAFRKIQQQFNAIRRKHQLAPLPNYLYEIEGVQTLICDLATLFPQKKLPSSFAIVGPLVYHDQQNNDAWINEIPTDKPIICVCMGSTGKWERLHFLNDPHYANYTVVTAGDQQKVLSAPHIYAKDFINLDKLLKKSSLMICHGGNGTIYHGIFNQVYMLCIPGHFEQEWNIQALENSGQGKSAVDFNATQWKNQIAAYCSYSGNPRRKRGKLQMMMVSLIHPRI